MITTGNIELILQLLVYTGKDMTLGLRTVSREEDIMCHTQNNQELLDFCQEGPQNGTIVHHLTPH